jgi:hypothetical protein
MYSAAQGPTGQKGCYSVSYDDDDKDERAIICKFETKRRSFEGRETLRGIASTCFFQQSVNCLVNQRFEL